MSDMKQPRVGARLGFGLLLVAAATILNTTIACAQDGWLRDDSSRRRSASATVQFTTGHALAVRCTRDQMEVVVAGLPPASPLNPGEATGAMQRLGRKIEVYMDGRKLSSATWLKAPDETMAFYTAPGALARALLTGQELTLRLVPETGPATRIVLPLPPDRSQLEAVITECELPLVDARDDAPDLSIGALADAQPSVMPAWRRMPFPQFPRLGEERNVKQALVVLSCLAEPSGRVKDCRAEFTAPPGMGFAEAALTAVRRGTLEPREDTVDRPFSFTMYFMLQ